MSKVIVTFECIFTSFKIAICDETDKVIKTMSKKGKEKRRKKS